MSKCNYCYGEIRTFCQMDETELGRQLRDSLVIDFGLDGIFPCDHTHYTDWADWYNLWKDDMMRYFRIHEVQE